MPNWLRTRVAVRTPTRTAPVVSLSVPTFTATTSALQGGIVFAVETTATLGGAQGANPVQGLSVTFADTFATAGSSVPPFSPTSVLTDGNGHAVSYVVVPYGGQIVVEVSAGGTVSHNTSPTPELNLTTPTFEDTNLAADAGAAIGEVYLISTMATAVVTGTDAGTGTPPLVEGLVVNFGPGMGFSPAAPITNSMGVAQSYITVVGSGQVPAAVSAMGFSAEHVGPP